MICKKFAKSKQNIHLAKSKQNKIFIPFGTKQNKILITAQFELWKKMTFLRVKILKIWPKNEPLPSPILIFEAGLPEGFGISFGISSQNHLGSPQIRSVKINYPPPSNCMTKEMTSHIPAMVEEWADTSIQIQEGLLRRYQVWIPLELWVFRKYLLISYGNHVPILYIILYIFEVKIDNKKAKLYLWKLLYSMETISCVVNSGRLYHVKKSTSSFWPCFA